MKQVKFSYKTNISLWIKRSLRKSVGAHTTCPIHIILGSKAPSLKGESYYYSNKHGDRIWHPGAYRRAWGKPIYHSSTLRVEVGSDWLLNNLTLEELRLHSLRACQ
jgi:hypothetical protein